MVPELSEVKTVSKLDVTNKCSNAWQSLNPLLMQVMFKNHTTYSSKLTMFISVYSANGGCAGTTGRCNGKGISIAHSSIGLFK